MASVFRGYLIKGIDGTRVPEDYDFIGGDDSRSYTVYILLEPIREEEHDWNVPPNIDSELQKFWGDYFNRCSPNWINEYSLPFSQIEYRENDDCGELKIYETSLSKIRQMEIDEIGSGEQSGVLEKLVNKINDAMRGELDRRRSFKVETGNININHFKLHRRQIDNENATIDSQYVGGGVIHRDS